MQCDRIHYVSFSGCDMYESMLCYNKKKRKEKKKKEEKKTMIKVECLLRSLLL
jgi:organic radical activating enzyme